MVDIPFIDRLKAALAVGLNAALMGGIPLGFIIGFAKKDYKSFLYGPAIAGGAGAIIGFLLTYGAPPEEPPFPTGLGVSSAQAFEDPYHANLIRID